MALLNEEDKKLLKKFEEAVNRRPNESEALDFWSKLDMEEYDRLICLFKENEIAGMSEEIKLKLVGFLNKAKEGLSKVN